MVGELSGRQPYEEMEYIFKEGGRVKELENVFFLSVPSCRSKIGCKSLIYVLFLVQPIEALSLRG
jgi:hypothetical protein